MVELIVLEGSPVKTCKVVQVVGCVLERETLFSVSRVMSTELRMLVVGLISKDKRMEVEVGRRDIYSSSCNFLIQLVVLVNNHKTAQPSSFTTTMYLMNEGH
jgi:hypothetical protein